MAARSNPYAWNRIGGAVSARAMDRIGRLGLSPRQLELNRRWAVYHCAQYDSRGTDWDGMQRLDPIEREAVASLGFAAPGFADPGGQSRELPIKYRRPSVTYNLAKVIVDRFTGLLFSERRHPNLDSDGDPRTEDAAQALAEATRLWSTLIKARTLGGAMGSVATSFAFVEGRPIVEVHDPRWTIPTFVDRAALRLSSLDKRYMYPVETRDPETGLWVTQSYWHRRVVDEERDVVYAPTPVGEGDEPEWVEQVAVEHRLGFCPAVWTQNLPVDDDIDGDPDCHGIWDALESIDFLLSQANRGILRNCDPTLALEGVGDLEMLSVKKGSDNAIKLPQGSSKYLEIAGSGPAAAREFVKELRAYALEVAQCVLEHPDVGGRTATEVERAYSSMLAKADVLREQYGQRLVIPLVEMMLEAARKLDTPRLDPTTGELVRYALDLRGRDGAPVSLGASGARVTIHWPGYFEPTLVDAQAAAAAAGSAKMSGLIDEENAVKFVAPYFRIDDALASLEALREEQAGARAALESEILRGHAETPDAGELTGLSPEEREGVKVVVPELPPETQVAAQAPTLADVPLGTKFFQYEIEGGIVTINEVRASKGLSPIPDGDLTLPAYRAKHAEVFARSALIAAAGSAERFLATDEESVPSSPEGGDRVGGAAP